MKLYVFTTYSLTSQVAASQDAFPLKMHRTKVHGYPFLGKMHFIPKSQVTLGIHLKCNLGIHIKGEECVLKEINTL
jgi:hypothetical protein